MCNRLHTGRFGALVPFFRSLITRYLVPIFKLAPHLPMEKLSGKVPRMLRIWPCFLILALPAASTASVPVVVSPRPHQVVLTEREHRVWRAPVRAAEFSDIPHVSSRSRCEDTQPPQALTTPDPLLVPIEAGLKVKVSFIVGADGRVHSPLILQSVGPAGDRNVLRTVRTWRYRPATCNGVPTEAEGKIEFSRR
jgi:TonB family protein